MTVVTTSTTISTTALSNIHVLTCIATGTTSTTSLL